MIHSRASHTRPPRDEPHPSTAGSARSLTPDQREILGYIVDMSAELSRMAAGIDVASLQSLLQRAQEEGQLIIARHDLSRE